jgi:3-hydroxyacyl-[acyl-carrier-protein] dehydratase
MVEDLLNKDIRKLIPHREPFIFIDRVISVESGLVVASKYIKKDEEYFKGHFPGNPLMPGVLIVESMAQTSGIACALYSNEQKDASLRHCEVYFLSRISDVKFKSPVLPGDTLTIKAKVIECFANFFKTTVICEVEGRNVAEGELVLTKQRGGAV